MLKGWVIIEIVLKESEIFFSVKWEIIIKFFVLKDLKGGL